MSAAFLVATAAGLAFACAGAVSLPVPLLLIGVCVTYLASRLDKTSLAAALIAALLYFGGFVVRPALLGKAASTAEEHLRAASAYSRAAVLPGQHESAIWRHYLAAANQRDPNAEFAVGSAYLYGHFGVSRDRAEARRWLTVAANQGHIGALRELPNVESIP